MKLLTLNINQTSPKHGRWPSRRERIFSMLQAVDVAALQAVRTDPSLDAGVDQATQLGRALEASLRCESSSVVFAPAHDQGGGVWDGAAFLSCMPLHDVRSTLLELGSPVEDDTRRLVMQGRVELELGSLTIFSCHFSWIEHQNRRNVEEALALIGATPGRRLVVGDFNAPAGSASLALFRQAGFTDVWARLRPHEAGHTSESHDPWTRIDYAWASPELLDEIVGIETAGDAGKGQAVRASDHLGLVVEVKGNASRPVS